MLIWLFIAGFLFFRWRLLEPFLGTARMYLFDAAVFVILAAANLAQPPSMIGFGIGFVCVLLGIVSANRYLRLAAAAKDKDNGEG